MAANVEPEKNDFLGALVAKSVLFFSDLETDSKYKRIKP
jgi:hypothetical protein